MSRPYSLRVSREQVLAFAAASHDKNPLHLDPAYSRRTAFGRPIVFGMLGAMASFGALGPAPAGWSLQRATLSFLGPLFEDTDYDVIVDARAFDAQGRVKLTTQEGGRALVRTTLQFGPAEAPRRIERSRDVASLVRRSAAQPSRGEVQRVVVAWTPAATELDALVRAFGLDERGIRHEHAAALMAASYLVGIELPGEIASFARAEIHFGTSPDRLASRRRRLPSTIASQWFHSRSTSVPRSEHWTRSFGLAPSGSTRHCSRGRSASAASVRRRWPRPRLSSSAARAGSAPRSP